MAGFAIALVEAALFLAIMGFAWPTTTRNLVLRDGFIVTF
jgi:hypothetical protein